LPQPLADKPLGSPFIELQSVDSTNNYARSLIKEGILPSGQEDGMHGTAIFAHEQTAGRGQWGKHWSSESSANIILSLIVDPKPLFLHQQFQLSACVALSIYEFFVNYAGEETKIKWPNDLYWQDRKAGGVLVESVVSQQSVHDNSLEAIQSSGARWEWAIIGIGININQTSFPDDLINPVSLKQITGKEFDPVDEAKKICELIDKNFNLLREKGFEPIFSKYNQHLYKANEKVKIKRDNIVIEVMILGVSKEGRLVVKHAIEEELDFGKVEWLR
jgi:BirA family biotin operon repressor/biotin-[acetyl-CoA-carboxylase] ligase